MGETTQDSQRRVRAARRRAMMWRASTIAGTLILITAISIFVVRSIEDVKAGEAAAQVREQIDSVRPATHPAEIRPYEMKGSGQDDDSRDPEMPTVCIGEFEYIGSIVIPNISMNLPVAATSDDDRLRISPCRYSGSYYNGDLVICGEGYASHFGRISSLGIRDDVNLVAVDGSTIHYIVSNVEDDRMEEITTIVDDWDLTLFTFNADGTCIVVRCVRTT